MVIIYTRYKWLCGFTNGHPDSVSPEEKRVLKLL